MRSFFLQSVLSMALCTMVIGCERIHAFNEVYADELKEILLTCQKQGTTVDSLDEDEDFYLLTLSDGLIVHLNKKVNIVRTDIRDFPAGESGEVNVLDQEPVNGIFGIVEGYTDWSFYLEDYVLLTLGKTLFSIDPDTVLRGINHRGYSVEAPENTLPAYRLSKLMGFKYVETDVRFTLDGVPVLIHDPTVDRTSDGNGFVKELAWEDLRKLDFGSWKSPLFSETRIPSLEEFLSLCQEMGLFPYLELKEGSGDQIRTIVNLVDRYGLRKDTVYISFSPKLLGYVTAVDPDATVGLLVEGILSEDSLRTADGLRTGTNKVFIDSSDYSENTVSMCHGASFPLEIWTVDDKQAILSLPPHISGVTSNLYHAGRLLFENGK